MLARKIYYPAMESLIVDFPKGYVFSKPILIREMNKRLKKKYHIGRKNIHVLFGYQKKYCLFCYHDVQNCVNYYIITRGIDRCKKVK